MCDWTSRYLVYDRSLGLFWVANDETCRRMGIKPPNRLVRRWLERQIHKYNKHESAAPEQANAARVMLKSEMASRRPGFPVRFYVLDSVEQLSPEYLCQGAAVVSRGQPSWYGLRNAYDVCQLVDLSRHGYEGYPRPCMEIHTVPAGFRLIVSIADMRSVSLDDYYEPLTWVYANDLKKLVRTDQLTDDAQCSATADVWAWLQELADRPDAATTPVIIHPYQ